MRLLKPGGEIHILDSHFYSLDDISEAKHRSVLYYESAGFPEMAAYYFHHNINELKNFKHQFLYRGDSIINKLLGKNDPFSWIRISK